MLHLDPPSSSQKLTCKNDESWSVMVTSSGGTPKKFASLNGCAEVCLIFSMEKYWQASYFWRSTLTDLHARNIG